MADVFDTSDMVDALLKDDPAVLAEASSNGNAINTSVIDAPNPQEHGWVKKSSYDYTTYNKTTKELADERAAAPATDADATLEGQEATSSLSAVGGLANGDWASNGAKYEWNEEYGDVGPRFADLEQQLFGKKNNHVRTGIKFDKSFPNSRPRLPAY